MKDTFLLVLKYAGIINDLDDVLNMNIEVFNLNEKSRQVVENFELNTVADFLYKAPMCDIDVVNDKHKIISMIRKVFYE